MKNADGKGEFILKTKIKHGLVSTFSIFIMVIFLLAVNLFINKFDLKYDLTKEKLYTISEQTKKIIDGVNQKINIYVLASSQNTNLVMSKLLEQYNTKNIKVEYKDPAKFPGFAKKFETGDPISDNSIIVSGEKNFKVIDANDLASYDYDYETFQTKLKSIDVEPQVTNAIRYVLNESSPVIYYLIGHGELKFDDTYKKQIALANYQIKDLDLITTNEIPSDCKILFITTAKRDWTSNEAAKIDKFLQGGGKAIFCIDCIKDDFANMTKVIKNYGFEFAKAIVVENSGSNFTDNNNLYLLPNYTDNEITHQLEEKKYKMFVPFCQSISINDNENVKPLLISSDNSYGKTNFESNTIAKEKNDLSGPLNLAILSAKNKTKIIAVGSTSVLDPAANSYIGGTNSEFIVRALNYLNGEDNNLYIPPKTHEAERIVFTQRQSLLISAACTIIIPCVIFVIGFIIVRGRRKK